MKLCLLLLLCIFALSEARESSSKKAQYPLGITFSNSYRDGVLTFDKTHSQHVPRASLGMKGVLLGRRYPISKHVRFQIQGAIDYGNTIDDTTQGMQLTSGDMKILTLQSNLFHMGLLEELQFPFKVADEMDMFLSVGIGQHYAKLYEEEYVLGEQSVRIIDPYLEKHSTVSLSVQAGGGFDLYLSNTLALCLSYYCRLWRPVRYKTVRDLFPVQPIQYHELFLTHALQIQLLIRR